MFLALLLIGKSMSPLSLRHKAGPGTDIVLTDDPRMSIRALAKPRL